MTVSVILPAPCPPRSGAAAGAKLLWGGHPVPLQDHRQARQHRRPRAALAPHALQRRARAVETRGVAPRHRPSDAGSPALDLSLTSPYEPHARPSERGAPCLAPSAAAGKPALIRKSGTLHAGEGYLEMDIDIARFTYFARAPPRAPPPPSPLQVSPGTSR